MGDLLQIGDFGTIVFYIVTRSYFNDKEGKLRYTSTKEPYTYEGVEITDADKTRIWIEGIDKSIPDEIFNVRRSLVVSFEKQDRPEVKPEP